MSTATLDRPISRSTPRRVSASPALVVERIPWSELGPEFIAVWGRPRGVNQPEHLEILGPTGSGKSFFLVQILHEQVVDDLPLEDGLIGDGPGLDQAIEQPGWVGAKPILGSLESAPRDVRES